ncbi:hypothetical protein HDV64DRAFT_290286 [Trichoderma sp. TUCIM 5745]
MFSPQRPPYQDYFYSDCHVEAQAVVTSPLLYSNLAIIGPRFIVAWPAGNSGICTIFQPQSGKNGSLAVEFVNSTLGTPLGPIYTKPKTLPIPLSALRVFSFNDSAGLPLAILGSVRNIRDYTEGGGNLNNVTTTPFTLVRKKRDSHIQIDNATLRFGPGFYHFTASFNYPQLKQLTASQILNDQSQSSIKQQPEAVSLLSVFSYSEKCLAGGCHFLTYFGRDSIISAFLLQPILRTGSGSAIEAVIRAALERVDREDGSISHEETIGDYATFPDQGFGQWRDSGWGLASGRIPFDVNCALAPAALYAISSSAAMPGVYLNNSVTQNWTKVTAQRAKVWEDKKLQFFQYNVTAGIAVARLRLTDFTSKNTFYNDTAFRHYLLNATYDEQLTTFINASANAVLRPFPVGLSTPIGVVVANPALSNDDVLIANFPNSAYHGTVVWSWQLALMAKGFEQQLDRCHGSSNATPQFCSDNDVYIALKTAYNKLWDIIENNSEQLDPKSGAGRIAVARMAQRQTTSFLLSECFLRLQAPAAQRATCNSYGV